MIFKLSPVLVVVLMICGCQSTSKEGGRDSLVYFFGDGEASTGATTQSHEVSDSTKKRGANVDSNDKLFVQRSAVSPSPKEFVPIDTTPEADGLLYPSLVEPQVATPVVEKAEPVKAYKVIDLGDEKIRVIDSHMGSVEGGDVQKLREQVSKTK